jgi:DNA-binding transcriptional MerR regulator
MELFSIKIRCTFQLVSTVCKALRITKRALQYYRSEGIIPSTSLGNKILYKESDIARILQNNLIAPFK